LRCEITCRWSGSGVAKARPFDRSGGIFDGTQVLDADLA
jgi:hypothetical protein